MRQNGTFGKSPKSGLESKIRWREADGANRVTPETTPVAGFRPPARSGPRPTDAEAGFRVWLRSPAGRLLCERERPHIGRIVRRFHGDTLLWIGPQCDAVATTDRCMVRTRMLAWSSAPASHTGGVGVVAAHPVALPFPPHCFDNVVLHHALDVAEDRRAALREVARVLPLGGRLLIVGFNPWSLWSLAKPWRPFRDMHPVSPLRLADWLDLLGFDREPGVHLSYRGALSVSLQGQHWKRASEAVNRVQLPFGGVYIVAATRIGHGMTALGRAPLTAPVAASATPAAASSSAVKVW